LRPQAGQFGNRRKQLGRVAKLRHRRGADEGANLDAAQPGGGEPL
jgi:hypothetical protein